MRTLIALLLMTTGAVAQDPIKGTSRGVTYVSHPAGIPGVLTASIVLENVSGQPLSIVVDGYTSGSIGPCTTKERDLRAYSGLKAGVPPSKADQWVGGPPDYREAARPLPAGSKVAVTMKIENCRKPAGSVDIALPLVIYAPDDKGMPVTVTILDVPVQ